MATTVFVVDANRSVATSIAQVLNHSDADIQALVCNDPSGAIQLAQAVKPDLVLLDMAGDIGSAVLCALTLRDYYSVKVALMTASFHSDAAIACSFPNGAQTIPVLRKPLEPQLLAQEIVLISAGAEIRKTAPASMPQVAASCRRTVHLNTGRNRARVRLQR